jgi:hypothetical protein
MPADIAALIFGELTRGVSAARVAGGSSGSKALGARMTLDGSVAGAGVGGACWATTGEAAARRTNMSLGARSIVDLASDRSGTDGFSDAFVGLPRPTSVSPSIILT